MGWKHISITRINSSFLVLFVLSWLALHYPLDSVLPRSVSRVVSGWRVCCSCSWMSSQLGWYYGHWWYFCRLWQRVQSFHLPATNGRHLMVVNSLCKEESGRICPGTNHKGGLTTCGTLSRTHSNRAMHWQHQLTLNHQTQQNRRPLTLQSFSAT